MYKKYDAVVYLEGVSKGTYGGAGVHIIETDTCTHYQQANHDASHRFTKTELIISGKPRKDWKEANHGNGSMAVYTANKIHDLVYPCASPVNSNECRVKALIISMEQILNYDWSNICLITPSKYLIDGITALLKHGSDNVLSGGSSKMANYDLWCTVSQHITKLNEKDIAFNIIHEESIPIALGYKNAWSNACKGLSKSMNGYSDVPITNTTSPEAIKFIKATPVHGLLMEKRWYFQPCANYSIDGYSVYYMGFHGKPSKKEKEDDWIGKSRSESSTSVVFLKEPDVVLAALYEVIKVKSNDSYNVHVGRMDNIANSKIRRSLEHESIDICQYDSDIKALTYYDDTPLIHEVNPPQLAMRLISHMDRLAKMAIAIRNNDLPDNVLIVNITDQLFYEEKGILKVRKEFMAEEKSIVVEIPNLPNVTLTLGLDIPVRNSLTRLSKLNPKISLYLYPSPPSSHRYYTYIEVDNAYGIFSAYESNLLI